ncbi:MAG: cardiolipin synthase [Syntrophomonadaceae bacterium]|nr:cardiolipin synthase [Syntrophomonadaceae bacterium]
MEVSGIGWPLVDIVFIINIFLVLVVVIFERRNPMTTLSWILLLVFMPLLGFLLYVFLGQNLRRKNLFCLKEEEEEEVLSLLALQDTRLHENSLCFNDSRVWEYRDLIHMQMVSSYSLLTQDNKLEVFHEGRELFDQMLVSLKNARDYIHMEYFIIRNDSLGRSIIDILSEKAQQGVEVKLLYDGMGCIRLPARFFKRLHEAGGESVAFLPPFLPYINLRINFRNHRKICIVDGEETYIGGFNIGNEYLGLSPRFGYWRDIHLKIRGSAIDSLEMRFLLDWRFAARDSLPETDCYFPDRYSEGTSAVQIVSSGPDMNYPAIKNGYLKLISKASRNVYIETPYFIPDESILEALKIAALSGVDVRLMIPYKPDHPYVYWASLSYIGELLDAGVRCYRYKRGFLHSKMICSDGFASSVGTANLDIRSFELNFEVNAFIYDQGISSQLEEQFLLAINDCIEITPETYADRPILLRIKEGIFRLLSPIF